VADAGVQPLGHPADRVVDDAQVEAGRPGRGAQALRRVVVGVAIGDQHLELTAEVLPREIADEVIDVGTLVANGCHHRNGADGGA
jgi:hypothetical protein